MATDSAINETPAQVLNPDEQSAVNKAVKAVDRIYTDLAVVCNGATITYHIELAARLMASTLDLIEETAEERRVDVEDEQDEFLEDATARALEIHNLRAARRNKAASTGR